jgi:hypoxanthine-guanine phosphoribosyltransferase
MCELEKIFLAMGALQVITISLLDKPTGRAEGYKNFKARLNGFVIPHAWAFGFGMDEGNGLDYEWVRNLLDIYYYAPKVNLASIVQPELREVLLAA